MEELRETSVYTFVHVVSHATSISDSDETEEFSNALGYQKATRNIAYDTRYIQNEKRMGR